MYIGLVNNNFAGTSSVGKSQAPVQEKNATVDTKDKVSHSEGKSFFSKVKDFVRNNITGTDPASKKELGCSDYCQHPGPSVGRAASTGAVVGGTVGAVLGYATTETDPSKIPVQSVHLTWQEPVMEKVHIGDIPKNYYEPIDNCSKSIGKEFQTAFKMMGQAFEREIAPTRPIYADSPKPIADGNVMMAVKSQVFEGKGEPVVKWHTHPIKEAELVGYKDNPVKDARQVVIGHTPDGTPVTKEVVDGIKHQFEPDIRHPEIGKYQTPEVSFEKPDPWVRAGEGLAIGALIGAGLGTVVGVLHKVIHK